MSKYDPLTTYLENQNSDVVEMTVVQLETLLGFQLPEYAKTANFWSNEADYEAPNRHPQDRAWQRAGYKAQHGPDSGMIRFIKFTTG